MKTEVKKLYTEEIDKFTGKRPKLNWIADVDNQLMTRRLKKILDSNAVIRELPTMLASELIENIYQTKLAAAHLRFGEPEQSEILNKQVRIINNEHTAYRQTLDEIEVGKAFQQVKNDQLREFVKTLLVARKRAKKELRAIEVEKYMKKPPHVAHV